MTGKAILDIKRHTDWFAICDLEKTEHRQMMPESVQWGILDIQVHLGSVCELNMKNGVSK